MNKLRTKTILLRTLLGVYRTARSALRYAGVLFLFIGRGSARVLAVSVLPLVRVLYRLGFGLRLRVARALRPLGGTLFGSLSHRHVIHVVVIIIAVATSTLSLTNRTVRAEDLGTQSLLYARVAGSIEELIEEEVPIERESFTPTSLVDATAISRAPAIDFDYIGEDYISSVSAVEARPSRIGTSVAPRTEIVKYTVQAGDVVSTIAEQYGLSLTTVLWANTLSVRSYIRPGDELTIPPLDSVLHTVKKNDTVGKLAKDYQAEEKDIVSWNKLGTSAALQVGEMIVVPGGRPPAAPAPRISAPAAIFRPSDGTSSGGGQLFWPIAARRITQYYGWRHTGLDVGAPSGTAIYAADDGIVELSGWTSGYGYNILVNHGNGMKTRYAHASRLFVGKNERVTRGQTIAAVGSTGRSTGPHIHFEVIISGRFRNPLEFIR